MPYVFPDPKDSSKLICFKLDIVEAIAKQLGVKAQLVQTAWDSLIPISIGKLIADRRYSLAERCNAAIARALAMKPQAMLFDEPTASLDLEMVGEVLAVINDLMYQEGMTTLISTHEMGFARKVADRVIIFADGDVIESGLSEEIFTNPKNEGTKVFLGRVMRRIL